MASLTKILFLFIIMCCQSVFAAKRFDGVYFFTSLGQSDYTDLTTESDLQRIENNTLTSLPAGLSLNLDARETSTSFALGLGYVFHRHLAVEASYQYLGSVKVSGPLTDDNDNTSAYEATGITAGFDVRTILKIPIYEQFEAFVNWGALLWSRETKTSYEFRGESVENISKDDGLEVVFGGGVQYLIPNGFGFSVAWEQYNIDQENVDVIKATLLYDFDIPI